MERFFFYKVLQNIFEPKFDPLTSFFVVLADMQILSTSLLILIIGWRGTTSTLTTTTPTSMTTAAAAAASPTTTAATKNWLLPKKCDSSKS